jgi:hypothetical protein
MGWQHPNSSCGTRERVELMSRLGRERRTVAVMIALYCRDHHGDGPEPPAPGTRRAGTRRRQEHTLCAECEALAAYADRRLDHCRFGADKPTCAHCAIHCYRPVMRAQIREVMRYSGPRMTVRHPVLALAHLVDRRRTPGEGSTAPE